MEATRVVVLTEVRCRCHKMITKYNPTLRQVVILRIGYTAPSAALVQGQLWKCTRCHLYLDIVDTPKAA